MFPPKSAHKLPELINYRRCLSANEGGRSESGGGSPFPKITFILLLLVGEIERRCCPATL